MNSTFKHNLIQGQKGLGIFAKADFEKGSVILEFNGPILTRKEIPAGEDRYLQIGKDTFIGPSGDADDYVNHSCIPNCGVFIVGNRALLKAIVLIQKGTEITFDYSSTSTENDWSMPCKCGTFACRKVIGGYKSLDELTKERYKVLGMVPDYLKEIKS